MVQALVLTAGFGKRLDPLTRLVAKPAVPVAGRPLIERVLLWLRAEGVTRAVLNLHHRPETIAAIVGDGQHLGLHVRYSWEKTILGSAGGPRHALPLMDLVDTDTFVIVNGDTLTDLALGPMREAHLASGADVTMAVVPNHARDRYNGILANDARHVTAFVLKGHTLPSWHFIGVQMVRARVFAALPDGQPSETVAGVYRDLLREPGRVQVWPVHAPFIDVGTPADYLTAALTLANAGGEASCLEGDVTVAASAHLTRSVVWPGARIGAHASLTECIVAGAAIVPEGLSATRKVIVPSAIARPDDRCEHRNGIALFEMEPELLTSGF